ncbi:endolytic transglycosylase MltG [Psittacicella hinzii]|uniref:Endolytic murein transglycosylase n=1 Tax=Psittacicella hinzii TaxID=2028575 RepID=A0A3A1YMS3_9GAMM|nr:endolytic transglycosylase MltG [Psittacicella hinzii]RIY38539.1 hypothetical protein CKF58_04030 [Psittacicella hinzii]
MKKIITALLALLALALAAGFTAYNYAQSLGKVRLINNALVFNVKKGETLTSVINRLIGEQPSWRIKLYLKFNPKFHTIRSAYYDLKEARNLEEALTLLESGKGLTTKINLIPGKTWKQYKSYLNEIQGANNNLKGLSDPEIAKQLNLTPIAGDKQAFKNLEGYFAPNTYLIDYMSDTASALRLAHKDLVKNLQQAWDSRNSRSQAKTPYELLILASIIEKEKGNNEEAPLISAVFNNRLAIGMPLQADPTVIYGMGDSYKGNITKNNLRTPTPYNTYTIPALPPTPIANVSVNSLMAAAQPTNVDYLYFMAVYGQGKHAFAKTYEQHLVNVEKFNNEYRKNHK